MITISNEQRKIKIEKTWTHDIAQMMLKHLDYLDFDLAIRFVPPKVIQTLNKQYRQQDKVTDILTFPMFPKLKAGKRIKLTKNDLADLGDMIICPLRVQEDAQTYQVTFQSRLHRLLSHGVAHLLGYNHYNQKDHELMEPVEKELLEISGFDDFDNL